MPVDIPSIYGKADYDVVRAIEAIGADLNSLAQRVQALRAQLDQITNVASAEDLQQLTARVNVLAQDVDEGGTADTPTDGGEGAPPSTQSVLARISLRG